MVPESRFRRRTPTRPVSNVRDQPLHVNICPQRKTLGLADAYAVVGLRSAEHGRLSSLGYQRWLPNTVQPFLASSSADYAGKGRSEWGEPQRDAFKRLPWPRASRR